MSKLVCLVVTVALCVVGIVLHVMQKRAIQRTVESIDPLVLAVITARAAGRTVPIAWVTTK